MAFPFKNLIVHMNPIKNYVLKLEYLQGLLTYKYLLVPHIRQRESKMDIGIVMRHKQKLFRPP